MVPQTVAVVLVLLLSPPAYPSSTLSHQEAAALTSRLGVSTTRLWLDHSGLTIPPSQLSPAAQNAEIEWGLRQYQTIKNGYGGVSTTTSVMQLGMGGLIGAALLYGGPHATVTVPLTLLGAASYISLDLTNSRIEEIGKDRAAKLLGRIKDDLVKQAGVHDFRTLVADRELFRDTVGKSQDFLQDLKRRAAESGDQGLINTATDVLQRTAMSIDAATLDQLGSLSETVSELDVTFGEFIHEVHQAQIRIDERLDDHTALIVGVTQDLYELRDDVRAVDAQVNRLGHNQGLIADFMFSGLSPREKVSALRSGLMDDRIRCPDSNRDCDPREVKTALISQYQTETEIEKSIATAGKILQGIGDIRTIAGNLGVDIGKDGQRALQIANGAVTAYMGVMTGNYLGAVASVTGMFGKRKDPDAERFRIMMEYLQKQFGLFNKKLDAILENQQKIMDAVVSVSKQLTETYRALDLRLQSLKWEQDQMSQLLKDQIWAEWRPCYSIYHHALTSRRPGADEPFINAKALRFASFEDVRAVIDQRTKQAGQCLNTVRLSMDTISATRWFGTFLDARRALETNTTPDNPELQQEAHDWRQRYKHHMQDVIEPTTVILFDWAGRAKISPATLLQLHMQRISTVSRLGRLVGAARAGERFDCDSRDEFTRAARNLVCVGDGNEDRVARDLMTFAINVELLLEISDWLAVFTQIAGLYGFDSEGANDERFARDLADLASFRGMSRGSEITRQTVNILGLAIAYYERIYGGFVALAMAEDILGGVAHERHAQLLNANPYLRENTGFCCCTRYARRGIWKRMEEGRSLKTFTARRCYTRCHKNKIDMNHCLHFSVGTKSSPSETGW